MEQETVPNQDELTMVAKSMPLQNGALFSLAYLTGGRINEILPKRFILRSKTNKQTREVTKWKEEINYSGIKKNDITYKELEIRGEKRKFLIIHMLNEKNRQIHTKDLPVRIDKEKELVEILQHYLDTKQDEDILFPFSDVTAWHKLRKYGFHPHLLRHYRTTHLITVYRLRRELVIWYMGWSDDRQLKRYAHLFWPDIAMEL